MKVLMLGWEFPPFTSGGLGTACHGLTKGLCKHGVDVTFVLPKAIGSTGSSHVKLIVANNVYIDSDKLKIMEVDSLLVPYISSEAYSGRLKEVAGSACLKQGSMSASADLYGKDLFQEVSNYAGKLELISAIENYDVIHAHDWMTYPAAIKAKRRSGKPLVVHIHATEFDRTAGHPNQNVYDIEREGFHAADMVLAVSSLTKSKVIEHYGIPPQKVEVVHNAVEWEESACPEERIKPGDKVVLYLGRITIQKGPEYFLYSAKRVLEKEPDVKFVIAGDGDMTGWIIEKAAELGISRNVLFTGFLTGRDIDRAYRMADLYVMPSVSEPFGITPLEAMRNGTPCMISKNSGVSEVISHCLKVDFWDIDKMSSNILSVLSYSALYREMRQNGFREVSNLRWETPAMKCYRIYRNLAKC